MLRRQPVPRQEAVVGKKASWQWSVVSSQSEKHRSGLAFLALLASWREKILVPAEGRAGFISVYQRLKRSSPLSVLGSQSKIRGNRRGHLPSQGQVRLRMERRARMGLSPSYSLRPTVSGLFLRVLVGDIRWRFGLVWTGERSFAPTAGLVRRLRISAIILIFVQHTSMEKRLLYRGGCRRRWPPTESSQPQHVVSLVRDFLSPFASFSADEFSGPLTPCSFCAFRHKNEMSHLGRTEISLSPTPDLAWPGFRPRRGCVEKIRAKQSQFPAAPGGRRLGGREANVQNEPNSAMGGQHPGGESCKTNPISERGPAGGGAYRAKQSQTAVGSRQLSVVGWKTAEETKPIRLAGPPCKTKPIWLSPAGPGDRLCETKPIFRRATYPTIPSFQYSNPMPIVRNKAKGSSR